MNIVIFIYIILYILRVLISSPTEIHSYYDYSVIKFLIYKSSHSLLFKAIMSMLTISLVRHTTYEMYSISYPITYINTVLYESVGITNWQSILHSALCDVRADRSRAVKMMPTHTNTKNIYNLAD